MASPSPRTTQSMAPRQARPWVTWIGPAAIASLLAIAVASFNLLPGETQAPDAGSLTVAADFDRLLRRQSAPYELTVRRGEQRIEVSEIESSKPNVRLYLIE